MAGIAQMVEQLICNQKVVGSIPTVGTNLLHPLQASLAISHVFARIGAFAVSSLACYEFMVSSASGLIHVNTLSFWR